MHRGIRERRNVRGLLCFQVEQIGQYCGNTPRKKDEERGENLDESVAEESDKEVGLDHSE